MDAEDPGTGTGMQQDPHGKLQDPDMDIRFFRHKTVNHLSVYGDNIPRLRPVQPAVYQEGTVFVQRLAELQIFMPMELRFGVRSHTHNTADHFCSLCFLPNYHSRPHLFRSIRFMYGTKYHRVFSPVPRNA